MNTYISIKIKTNGSKQLTAKKCTISSILQSIQYRIETKHTTRAETKTCQTMSSCHH